MTYRQDAWEIAAQQHGVVSINDALTNGIPAVEIRKLASRGALKGYGNGIYTHLGVPLSDLSQPALAVALAGNSAFLHRESVLSIIGIGNFNPTKIFVATPHRTRRTLPKWVRLERRTDVSDDEMTQFDGIPITTVYKTLKDLRYQVSSENWFALISQAQRLEYLNNLEANQLLEPLGSK